MKTACFYFQVHQPYRMRNYHILEIGKNHNYFDDVQNTAIIRKVADKCYLPANRTIAELIRQTGAHFRVAYSISGVALEQMQRHAPEVIDSFQDLARTGGVEFLSETYYHSLAAVYSEAEFEDQVWRQFDTVKRLFGYTPTTFRNTELIFSDHLAYLAEKLGFKAVLTEGTDWLVGRDGANWPYKAKYTKNLKVLLRNYRLSDDIAFRFSAHNWSEYPLFADKWASWVASTPGPLANIFIDYETFGEHHWESSGIFDFLRYLPQALFNAGVQVLTPCQVVEQIQPQAEIATSNWISWADVERDLSAWLGNEMQRNAMDRLFQLESAVKASRDPGLLEDWRRLSTSDHFYYMSTKFAGDAEVHNYFNPHQGPHYAFITMMRILNDVEERANQT
jgi:alpha-amylase